MKRALRVRRKTRKGRISEYALDKLWAEKIRERDVVCRFVEYLGHADNCAGPVQAAHVYSRSFRQIRHALENGLGLCASHHFFVHKNPVLAGRFYEQLLGKGLLDTLWIRAQAKGKVDRVAVKAYLLNGGHRAS